MTDLAATGLEPTVLDAAPDVLAPMAYTATEESPESPHHRSWRSAWTAAAGLVAVGVLALAAAAGVHLHHRAPGAPAPSAPPPGAAPAPSVAAPPAPPTTSATSPPPATPALGADDQRFLGMLHRDGVPDPQSVSDVIAAAALVCRMISGGDDYGYVETQMMAPHGSFTQSQAQAFAVDAVSAYCPHAALGAPGAPPAPLSPDERYIDLLRAAGDIVDDKAQAVADAHNVCNFLAAGHSSNDAIANIIEFGGTRALANAVVQSAIAVYCPRYFGR